VTQPLPPYQPVSCELHSRLELAILRRLPVDLLWLEDGKQQQQLREPVDLVTSQGEEYLCLADGGTIRLDQIISFKHPDS
jgi:Rho-binding antiterminator